MMWADHYNAADHIPQRWQICDLAATWSNFFKRQNFPPAQIFPPRKRFWVVDEFLKGLQMSDNQGREDKMVELQSWAIIKQMVLL